ncbi:hypothetical protein A6V29_04905 [Blastococcus sp. CCUG 61487]|nr:hypothetical protein A6V29_04905 [Blastococcus sp. CCUG 61487]
MPPEWMSQGARQLEILLGRAAGPTRCGPVIVRAFFTADDVDQAFTDPILADVPDAHLSRARATWLAAQPGWLLLIAHCRVLWRQPASQVQYS